MIEIERTYNGNLPLVVFGANERPRDLSPSDIARLAWRHGLRPLGSFHDLDEVELQLLDVVRLAAIYPALSPDQFAELIARTSPPSDEAASGIAAAATVALRDPAKMRWISVNAASVANSPQWNHVVAGLTGLTVSVPLAEEALINLIKAKTKPAKPLGTAVQLNVWFSRRFAARFRRRAGARRVRIRERGATARAWSHARTSLGHAVPFEWSSRHGRGVGRPLDDWSVELLESFVDAFETTFPDGPPATVASLYAIAAGAIHHRPSTPGIGSDWTDLPLHVENSARRLIGLEPVGIVRAEAQALETLKGLTRTT